MIREIITPTERELTVQLPEEYLNRPVEVLVFPVSDTSNTHRGDPRKTFEQVVGILSPAQAEDMIHEIETDRLAWEERMEMLEQITCDPHQS